MINVTESNKDLAELENSDGFREGVLAVLCFIAPLVVVVLAAALYFIR